MKNTVRLTDADLAEIAKRNEERQELRRRCRPHRWTYDSFAFIEPERDTTERGNRPCVLIRRRAWFDDLIKRHGSNVLDLGIAGAHREYMQPAHVGLYIEAAMNDPIEDDIARLIAEVKRLRS